MRTALLGGLAVLALTAAVAAPASARDRHRGDRHSGGYSQDRYYGGGYSNDRHSSAGYGGGYRGGYSNDRHSSGGYGYRIPSERSHRNDHRNLESQHRYEDRERRHGDFIRSERDHKTDHRVMERQHRSDDRARRHRH